MSPVVSVIIPTFRDWGRLRLCLDALARQSFEQDAIEVIVVNNDPSDAPPADMQLADTMRIIDAAKPGSYAARNAGLAQARGEIIAFTDSDCIPETDWIANAVNMFGADDAVDRLAGPIEIFREEGGSWLAWKYEAISAFKQHHNVRQGVSVTANLFVKRAVFDRVGLFDETLMSGGDIDWNQRATEAGVTLRLAEQVRVRHPARQSMRAVLSKTRRMTGGHFMRAKAKGAAFGYVLWHFLPPVRFAKVLMDEGRRPVEVMLAVMVFWSMKLLMVPELCRLALGGRPVR